MKSLSVARREPGRGRAPRRHLGPEPRELLLLAGQPRHSSASSSVAPESSYALALFEAVEHFRRHLVRAHPPRDDLVEPSAMRSSARVSSQTQRRVARSTTSRVRSSRRRRRRCVERAARAEPRVVPVERLDQLGDAFALGGDGEDDRLLPAPAVGGRCPPRPVPAPRPPARRARPIAVMRRACSGTRCPAGCRASPRSPAAASRRPGGRPC